MKNLFKYLILSNILLSIAINSFAAEPRMYTVKYGGEEREYFLYIPDVLNNTNEKPPLVIVLHGYGGKAMKGGSALCDVADTAGFVVCFPQGEKDPKNKTGWNVGYPSQEGLKRDDVGFLVFLTKHVSKCFGTSRENVFCTGMSNGGEMCYQLAYQKPGAFKAFASIAGLNMAWLYESSSLKEAVPFMEVHGTSDKTSKWEGDPYNQDGWGRYIAVPIAVNNLVCKAKCTHKSVVELPVKRNRVILHKFISQNLIHKSGNPIEVRLYEVQGGGHSWADKDLDTYSQIWDFFRLYCVH